MPRQKRRSTTFTLEQHRLLPTKVTIAQVSYTLRQYGKEVNRLSIYIRRIKRFPAKTFTNVGMVQRVIKNRVRAPTHHTGNKSPDTRRGSLASLAIHNPCRSRFIAFKRLCIHCTQVNILRLQVTLKPLSPSLHLATCVVKVACMSI